MTKAIARSVVGVLALLALAGCEGSQTAPSGEAPRPAVTSAEKPTASTPTPKPTPRPMTAGQVAKAIAATVPQAKSVKVWTEETDPNHLMGRPNGYISAATLTDGRAECTDASEPGASCGATVEMFANEEDAKARAEYIAAILKGAPMLGTEYDTQRGAALLRVSGDLPPTAATAYASAFGKAVAA